MNHKDVTCCVVDFGLFLPLALKLGKEFKHTYYYLPSHRGFPLLNDCVVGDGFDEIERIEEIWSVLPDVDLFVFPDLQFSELQLYLESLGKKVWGSRNGDDLELRRGLLKKTQERLGLDLPEYTSVKGISNLRSYLREHQDKFIKISKYRGCMETFHHISYELSQPMLDHLALLFGPLQDEVPFIVETPVKTDLEVGYDGWSIDGQWPIKGLQGWEAKDKALIASVQNYDEMAPEVTVVNEAFSPVLKEYHYRNFLSTEIRLAGEKSVMIDITCRAPSPGLEIHVEIWENIAELIWAGANGELIEPVPAAKFGVECMIDHTGDENRWRILEIPAKAEPWVKLYSACKYNDLYCLPPFPHSHDTIGAVVGIGNTIEAAIEHLKSTVELLKDQPVMVHTEALYDTMVAIHKAEKEGIEFTEQTVPEPETVLQ